MGERIFAKPVAGFKLPLPDGRPWPAEGEFVEKDRYVRRRLAAGEIVETAPPPEPAEPAPDATEAPPAGETPAPTPSKNSKTRS